ncbi:MAG TPA: dethiobiotin synthase [Candidatus Limnocylindrales bacterium]|nr:dethiobiotin synthase [Candidatus Limnocylindrales bacterium]
MVGGNKIVVVTGTDTGVGKTIVTAALAAAATAAGLRVAVVKPAQTGDGSDAVTVARLANPTAATTLASFPDPLAPLAAARVAGMDPLDLFALTDTVRQVEREHDLTLVEGAGGLLVPMGLRPGGQAWTIADMAVVLDAPAVVVSRAGLGTLNHTALTLEALERRGIPARVVIGAWPQRPELVHFTNLVDLPGRLHGLLPDGAGAMEPGVFQRSAPGWLTGELHGTCDDPRELATGEED